MAGVLSKQNRRSRRVILLAATGIAALLLTGHAGTAGAFAAAPVPVNSARIIHPPRHPPNPDEITASTAATCAMAAYKAGFPMNGFTDTERGYYRTIVVAVAIGMAESGCDPAALNGSGSCASRGVWQIEQCWWPRVTETCLGNAQCNGDAAWNYVYRSGDTFCWWQTYDPSCGSGYNGAWVNYISAAQAAVGGLQVTLGDAGTGMCLAADASDAVSGGIIWQYRCDPANIYEQWYVQQGSAALNPILRNAGTGMCLDAKAGQAGNRGRIMQWQCNATSDPHQQWGVNGNANVTDNDVAMLNLQDSTSGNGTCLAADASQAQDHGGIWQWSCGGYNSNGYLDWN